MAANTNAADEQRPRSEVADVDRSMYDFVKPEKGYERFADGLSGDLVEQISRKKDEPDWMLQMRLKALETYERMEMPKNWGPAIGGLDMSTISTYVASGSKQAESWDEVPDDIKDTFERLGIPEAERTSLAGVGAQYDSEIVYHNMKDEVAKSGVVYTTVEDAMKSGYEDMIREHFGTPVEVGDSDSLQVGDWVMSLGSPFGLEQSVSTGIVSSLYRSTMLQSTSGNTIYTNLIQTDATINPGNSGGALVNSKGQLVGINSLIESYSGSSSGVGFAIPGNYAVDVAKKLIAGETVTHAYIGGSFQTVNAQNARSNNLSVNQGAYVAEVAAGGPAEQAGIQQGDVVTAIDDDEITSSDAMLLAVRSHSVGDTVTVTLMRGSKQMQVQVTLGSDEALQQQQDSDSSSQGSLLEQYLEQYGNSYGNGGGYGNGNGGRSSR